MNAKHISSDLKLQTVLRLSEMLGWGEDETPCSVATLAFCKGFDQKLQTGQCVRVCRAIQSGPGVACHTWTMDILPPKGAQP